MKKTAIFLLIILFFTGIYDNTNVFIAAEKWSFNLGEVNSTIHLKKNERVDFDVLLYGKEVPSEDYTITFSSSDENVVYIVEKTGEARADKYKKLTAEAECTISAYIVNNVAETSTTKKITVIVDNVTLTATKAPTATATKAPTATPTKKPTSTPTVGPTATPKPTVTPTPTSAPVIKIRDIQDDFVYYIYSNYDVEIREYTGKARRVVIPDSILGCPVTAIADFAFYNCDTVEELVMPSTVRSIGTAAFYGTPWLAAQPRTNDFVVLMGKHYIYCGNDENVTVPQNARTVDFYMNNTVKQVFLSETVTKIGANAFRLCTSLENICIPESVTYIGQLAFAGCKSLLNVHIPSSVKVIDTDAFFNCSVLKSVNISEGILEIGDGAFKCCKSLTSVSLPEGLMNIGSNAFYDCPALIRINIPDSVLNVGENAFAGDNGAISDVRLLHGAVTIGDIAATGCCGLTSYSFAWNTKIIADGEFRGYCALESIVIPEGVTEIGDNAFENCKELKSITFPSSLMTIGKNVFRGCSALKEVKLPYGVAELKEGTFEDCTALTDIVLPDGLVTIGERAFHGCSALKNIKLPKSLNEIGQYAFSESGIMSVSMPEEVAVIGTGVFSSCKALTQIGLSENLSSIESEAFKNCRNLSAVELPAHLKFIGKSAFANCEALLRVDISSETTIISMSAFEDCYNLTLRGSAGSYAERYARDNSLNFAAK